ncbi:hypothetical protein [Paenibacillus polymyxa]|uniref:hypothetical protein n=1 Tax=Paenibacillus polymyxa TaxID=1406 RepID=UPI0032B01294
MDSRSKYNRSMMGYNNLRDSNNSSGYFLEQIRKGEIVRAVDLFIGGNYVVSPLNLLKIKHRDRRCVIAEFELDELDNPIRAKVRFDDNNRLGMVDLNDLDIIQSS